MELVVLLWLFSVVENLFICLTIFLVVVPVAIPLIYSMINDCWFDDGIKILLKNKVFTTAWFIALFLAVFIPSKTDLMIMTGVYYGQKLIKETSESTVTQKAVKLLEQELDKALSETK